MKQLKKSWFSNSTRRDTNKYNCQTCNKEQEKARRIKQIKKGVIHV